MSIIFDTRNVLLLTTTLLSIILGLLIYFNGRSKRINKVYTWNIIAIIGWIVSMILFRSSLKEFDLFWSIILYISATPIASSFLYFTYIFPTEDNVNFKKVKWLIFSTNVLLILLIGIPGYIIKEVNIRPGLEKEIIFTKFYLLYVLYTLTFFSFAFYRLFKKYKRSIGVARSQIFYLLIGYASAANLAFITNLIMPWAGYFFLNWLGQAFAILMAAFTTYAVVKHHLMDARIVLRNSFVYLGSLVFLMTPIILINYLAALLYLEEYSIYFNLFLFLSSLAIFEPIKKKVYRFANKYFFSSLYDSNEVISKLSDQLRSIIDIDKLYKIISTTLISTFHTKSVAVLVLDQKSNKFEVVFNDGFEPNGKRTYETDPKTINKMINLNQIVSVEEVKSSPRYQAAKKQIDLLESLGVEIVLPLTVKDQLIGIIVLGHKESKDTYNTQDFQILEVIRSQAAIALENALLYRESLEFGEKLKVEVKKATSELRVANQKLKKLDQAKTEFLSITSHQLRTPLSGIKGYMSMLIDGDFGKYSDEQGDVMGRVKSEVDRLIRLVQVFLNVSRIESGRLEIAMIDFDLNEMINTVVTELRPSVETHKLTLDYTPGKAVNVTGDPDKLKDVVVNLVDNAIKYTEQGGITVSISQDDQETRVTITDTGVGIDPKEIGELFSKFKRAKGIAQVSASGSGLGLFIAKKIIEGHGGKIWAESSGKGKGSNFVFTLPRTKKSAKKASRTAVARKKNA